MTERASLQPRQISRSQCLLLVKEDVSPQLDLINDHRSRIHFASVGNKMKLALLALGALLLLQTAIHVVLSLIEGPITFTTIGKQVDKDLVRLTAGLCAVQLARLTKANR